MQTGAEADQKALAEIQHARKSGAEIVITFPSNTSEVHIRLEHRLGMLGTGGLQLEATGQAPTIAAAWHDLIAITRKAIGT